jgi:hypothetical protein
MENITRFFGDGISVIKHAFEICENLVTDDIILILC